MADPDAVEIGVASRRPPDDQGQLRRLALGHRLRGPTGDSPEREEFVFSFEARPAKQVWISGEEFPRVENWLYAFSIAEVEVLDPTGRNVALATTGTGITVSSTMHS